MKTGQFYTGGVRPGCVAPSLINCEGGICRGGPPCPPGVIGKASRADAGVRPYKYRVSRLIEIAMRYRTFGLIDNNGNSLSRQCHQQRAIGT